MIAKITRGRGFKGVLEYNLQPDKQAVIVGGNLGGGTSRALAAQLIAASATRPDIAQPVWHCSLSLPPGERPADGGWRKITADFMRHMKFGPDVPWVAIRHHDTEHDNVHIVASRVGYDAKVWLGQHEVPRAHRAARELEKKYGLTQVHAKDRKTWLPPHEQRAAKDNGNEPPARGRIQDAVDAALVGRTSLEDFTAALAAEGVTVQLNKASTGRISGISFAATEANGAEVTFKGSQLGKNYSWSALLKRGLAPALDAAQEPPEQTAQAAQEPRTGNLDNAPAAAAQIQAQEPPAAAQALDAAASEVEPVTEPNQAAQEPPEAAGVEGQQHEIEREHIPTRRPAAEPQAQAQPEPKPEPEEVKEEIEEDKPKPSPRRRPDYAPVPSKQQARNAALAAAQAQQAAPPQTAQAKDEDNAPALDVAPEVEDEEAKIYAEALASEMARGNPAAGAAAKKAVKKWRQEIATTQWRAEEENDKQSGNRNEQSRKAIQGALDHPGNDGTGQTNGVNIYRQRDSNQQTDAGRPGIPQTGSNRNLLTSGAAVQAPLDAAPEVDDGKIATQAAKVARRETPEERTRRERQERQEAHNKVRDAANAQAREAQAQRRQEQDRGRG